MSAWNTGAVIVGEYTIEKELGRGGMGRVWLVKSNSTGRRFAVKQALIQDEKHRKAFLTELQTWIDLPEHPNIVPCRFFRTVGDEIVIFADYIEGGSLADWIAKGKLTGLEQILDVAIQFAWGLHTIHERGLIHQDVKPGNVLMTPEGVPMVTDFGLARARLRSPDGAFVSPALPPGPVHQSVLVSSGGMTPAYASPEQRNGKPLSRKTDIWSWGVSVLDIFMGGVSCPHGGHIAAEVLEDLASHEDGDSELPHALASVLRRCFAAEANRRWNGIDLVALHIESVYETLTGQSPTVRRHSVPLGQDIPHDRLSALGISWANPREWLLRALHLAGRDLREAYDFTERLSASKNGQAAADIACYDYALGVLERAPNLSDGELDRAIAELCVQKALVHEYSGDLQGSWLLVERAITTYEQLMPRQSGPFLVLAALASACNFAAILAHKSGRNKVALDSYERAIAWIELGVGRTTDRDVRRTLANLLLNRATALAEDGQRQRALRDYDNAIEVCRSMISEEPDVQSVEILSAAYLNRTTLFQDLAQYEEAERSIDEAIDIRENMASGINDNGRLANAYLVKGKLLVARGKDEEGRALYERGVALRLACIEQGRTELLPLLAEDYLNQCAALSQRGQRKTAQELAEKAVSILEDAVSKQGRTDLLTNLANACVNAACGHANLRDFSRASAHLARAIQVLEELVQRGDRRVCGQLDNALKMRQQITRDMSRQEADNLAEQALALSDTGRIGDALSQYRKALELDPNDPDIWVNYGAAYGRADDHQAALEAFEKALNLDPKNATAWHNKGAVLFLQARYEYALPALERAYSLGHQASMAALAKCRGMIRRQARLRDGGNNAG